MRVRRVSTSRRSETIVLRLRASTPAAASSRFSRPTSARSESGSRAARRTSLASARAAVSLSRPISNCRRQNRALARQSISPRRHSSARRLSRSNSDRQSGSPDVGADSPPPSGEGRTGSKLPNRGRDHPQVLCWNRHAHKNNACRTLLPALRQRTRGDEPQQRSHQKITREPNAYNASNVFGKTYRRYSGYAAPGRVS